MATLANVFDEMPASIILGLDFLVYRLAEGKRPRIGVPAGAKTAPIISPHALSIGFQPSDQHSARLPSKRRNEKPMALQMM